ncbi:MAG: hypothetical protein OK455_05930, partial [Thaumarchaeota archaeon]|nr:hypothetical protein [Nitrososphaerota archaeon]
MKKGFRSIALGMAVVFLLMFSFSPFLRASAAFTAPPTPWTQCPAVGADTSCAILIVVNSDGSVSIYADSSQGPFDGSEDTLVGVQDNCATCGGVTSLALSASVSPPIFGFEGDGACSGFYTPNPPAASCPGGVYSSTDPSDYEAKGVTLTVTNLVTE